MPMPVHILGFAGSLRRNSYNVGLLRAAHDLLPPQTTLEIHDLSDIPLYNQDLECEGLPEPVQHFKARIRAADALLITTPEYDYSIPGVLKNAIDWASRPQGQSAFDGKPGAIMGAGGRLGTARAQYHLRQICVHLNVFLINKPEVLVQFASEKFDNEGNLRDEATREAVRQQLVALVEWTRRLHGE